jgi:hypothetical protein
MQASCFYWAVTANTPAREEEMSRDDALLPENHDMVLAELTFGAPDRVKISWLEYWFYMCNQNEEIEHVIADVPMWSSKEEADELLNEEIAAQPVEDDGCEIGEDGEEVCEEGEEERKSYIMSSKYMKKHHHHQARHMHMKVHHK